MKTTDVCEWRANVKSQNPTTNAGKFGAKKKNRIETKIKPNR